MNRARQERARWHYDAPASGLIARLNRFAYRFGVVEVSARARAVVCDWKVARGKLWRAYSRENRRHIIPTDGTRSHAASLSRLSRGAHACRYVERLKKKTR